MITIRKASERGKAEGIDWLDSRHTFSFADYHDPKHMGFRALRVINDDRVKAGNGFGTHPHRDMEIISYVIDGAIAHKDSMGNGSVIRSGDVQRMSAGTGVRHSEFNPSKSDAVRFLQIWIEPGERGIAPGYEQKAFTEDERRGKLRLVASNDGREGSVTVHQDVSVYAGLFAKGERASVPLRETRGAWVQVARGAVTVNGCELGEGDGASIEGDVEIEVTGAGIEGRAEILVFDLA